MARGVRHKIYCRFKFYGNILVMKARTTRGRNLIPEKIIRGLPFLACLSDGEFESLKHILTEKRFCKGQLILGEEETHSYMYIVGSGRVKVVHFSSDGKEHLLAIHKKGDFFGEMALIDGKTAPAAVVAMEDSTIALIGKRDFETCLLMNAKVLREVNSMLCSRLREAWMMLKVLSLPDSEQRVKSALDLLGRQYGVKSPFGTLIALKLTHQNIADYASVSRETVSRLMKRLEKQELIKILCDKSILLSPSFPASP